MIMINGQAPEWKGKHMGTVKGKSFEWSRRERKTHQERKSEIASRDSNKK
jgi:hypothetical protein